MTTNSAPVVNVLGNSAYTENGSAVILDELAQVVDAELTALANGVGNYAGATLLLQRVDGVVADDTFSAMNDLRFVNSNAVLSGVIIGSLTNTNGRLFITFNNNATQDRLDKALSSIGYSNKSDAPPASVDIEWTFRDGNTGAQGTEPNVAGTTITTVNIESLNDAGSVSISGALGQNQTLTAVISDADTYVAEDVSYQWFANNVLLEEATGNSLLLDQNTVGKSIRVEASYIDNYGNTENVVSTSSGVIVNVNDAVTGSLTLLGDWEQGQELTADVGDIADLDGLGTFNYQWLADNVAISGANSSTLQLTQAQVGKAISLRLTYTDAFGSSERVISDTTGLITNINDDPTGAPTISGTATQGQVLRVTKGTLDDADGVGAISYQWLADGFEIDGATGSSLVLTQALVGSKISVRAGYTDLFGNTENATSAATQSVLNINDVPIGTVTIEGQASEGELLVASADAISDADGLGDFSYQWLANGQAIQGATKETLLLTQEVVDKRISIKVSYTDGQGKKETVSSLQTTAVTNVNDAPTGSVTVNGTPLQGQTLSFSHTLVDPDGMRPFNYQWRADAVNINGATNSTLVLGQAQAGKSIDLVVSYQDYQGTYEEVSSINSVVVGRFFAGTNSPDSITGTGGADRLLGSLGNDSFNGAEGNDTLEGGAGNDTLEGGLGIDSLSGNAGDDTYIINDLDVIAELLNEGTDTVVSSVAYTLGANLENLTLSGTRALNGTGNELANALTGNAAANSLSGGIGNDTLDGGAGIDTLVGGAGNDTYLIDRLNDVITEGTNSGTDTVVSSVTYTLALNLENVRLAGTDNINATGNTTANQITGNAGANQLDGGTGADTLTGGAGNDTYIVDNAGDVVTEAKNAGVDSVRAAISYTLGSNLENLILTGNANLNGTGNTIANQITGNAGANQLDGGAGADTLTGGAGNDTYIVDNAGDALIEVSNAGTDIAFSSVSYTLAANVENLTLTGSSAINGTGNTAANQITGNAGTNQLNGGSGADTLIGGAGTDTLDGGTGADSLVGGWGDDLYWIDSNLDSITELLNEGVDAVKSTISYALGVNVEALYLQGNAAINATGNILANTLIGNGAANSLMGGLGQDLLTGGLGNDTFQFAGSADSGITATTRDTITDFTRGQDKIDLSAIDANTGKSADQAFTSFITNTATFNKAGQLQFKGGVLYGNTDTDAAAEFSIAITGVATLSMTDITG